MGMVTDIKPYLNFDSVRKNIVYRLINTEKETRTCWRIFLIWNF